LQLPPHDISWPPHWPPQGKKAGAATVGYSGSYADYTSNTFDDRLNIQTIKKVDYVMNNTVKVTSKLMRSADEISHLTAQTGITGGDSRRQTQTT